MRRLSLTFLLTIMIMVSQGQKSPHGKGFSLSCKDCHNTDGWKIELQKLSFDHSKTGFALEGQHRVITCKDCHATLEFASAGKECTSCHVDVHQQTVGSDCGRCHTPNSWIVPDITALHQQSRFPLIGPHITADCRDCHGTLAGQPVSLSGTTPILFEPLGVNCYDCHSDNYLSAQNPNHLVSNYSTQCTDCHNINSYSWSGAGINHNFFPLTGGHDIKDCRQCHQTNDYNSTSAECLSCHLDDYNGTNNPSHRTLGFPTSCTECHTTNPGWRPAAYHEHDSRSFPIYSGKHNGEWNNCTDCHTNPSSYAQFSCIDCHEHNQSDMNNKHRDVNGYQYNSVACFACHPTGSGEGTFNHATSGFPLTGAHITTNCLDCHTNGFQNTPTLCIDCHEANYNQTINPNHLSLNFSRECADCHTTNPDWKPAQYTEHDSKSFPIYSGKHNGEWSICTDCHTNPANYGQFTCIDCHDHNQPDMNDKHSGVTGYQYNSQACFACHPTGSAEGAFNHSISGFPLTGAHVTAACSECHTNGYTNTPILCVDCHAANYNQSLNPGHVALNLSTECATCHTTNPGWVPATFPVHNNYYLLSGAHASIANECSSCHAGNYITTPNTCIGCHQSDYNQTVDPPHSSAQFPVTCEDCHNQNSWSPSTFNHDGQYFPIYSGKHHGEWNTCSDCHTNPSNYAVFSCIDCHEHNQTSMNQEHQGVSGYSYNSLACLNCHPRGNSAKIILPGRIDKTN
ncbi:MAG: hypothetical protein CVU06_02775 [Bacteroidetes bacterium HGW-Bacteroidetes-22]|nr:MAG: hypothetical protein CVU06_02775 [Bacteroidetes bacterium HGW-Bacteroidetes-22]